MSRSLRTILSILGISLSLGCLPGCKRDDGQPKAPPGAPATAKSESAHPAVGEEVAGPKEKTVGEDDGKIDKKGEVENGAAEPAKAAEAKPARVLTIGMSQCNLGEPWRQQMNADVREAAATHENIKAIFKDASNDTLKQRAHIEEFVSAGVDLIIVSPKEAAPLTEPIGRAIDAGIPVIVLDRRVLGDKYTCFIGADNKLIGREAGKWIARKLGGKGKVVELKGLMTSTPGQDRHSGFREGIAGSEIEIIFEADMKWLEPDARKEMESALARFDKIDLVYAHNDPGAHGAYLAAQAAERADTIMFVGIDALPHEGVMYVKQGILDATFQYPTGGREAIDVALQILNGRQVPKEITLGSRLYTKENVETGGEAIGG